LHQLLIYLSINSSREVVGSNIIRGGATPQLAWALAQAQLQLPLSQAQPLLGLLAFPADFCVNSAGNTFLAKIYPQEM